MGLGKVVAYYALHYGAEYLAYSIRSIYPAVDEILILYTQKPSHGQSTTLCNPEGLMDLMKALDHAGDPHSKINFSSGVWRTEGEHRDFGVRSALARGASLVLAVDADEVWDTDTLRAALEGANKSDALLFRVPFLHFWRSFRWICRDAMMPTRILKDIVGKEDYLYPGDPVYHFGYAQKPGIVRYKADIHGHKGEWRPGWFEEKFLGWKPGNGVEDVHPTCVGIWNPAPFCRHHLPVVMQTHPYFDREVIE